MTGAVLYHRTVLGRSLIVEDGHEARNGVANTNGVVSITKIGADTLVTSLHTAVVLRFDAEEWAAFLAGAADDEYDFTSQLAAT